MVRSLTGVHLCPWEVTFTYPPPASLDEYTRVFGCPVYFGQRENSLTVDLAIGKIPILMANEDLKNYFEQFAQNFINSMDNEPNESTNTVTRIITCASG